VTGPCITADIELAPADVSCDVITARGRSREAGGRRSRSRSFWKNRDGRSRPGSRASHVHAEAMPYHPGTSRRSVRRCSGGIRFPFIAYATRTSSPRATRSEATGRRPIRRARSFGTPSLRATPFAPAVGKPRPVHDGVQPRDAVPLSRSDRAQTPLLARAWAAAGTFDALPAHSSVTASVRGRQQPEVVERH